MKINKFLKHKSQNNQFNNLSMAAINVNIRIYDNFHENFVKTKQQVLL